MWIPCLILFFTLIRLHQQQAGKHHTKPPVIVGCPSPSWYSYEVTKVATSSRLFWASDITMRLTLGPGFG